MLAESDPSNRRQRAVQGTFQNFKNVHSYLFWPKYVLRCHKYFYIFYLTKSVADKEIAVFIYSNFHSVVNCSLSCNSKLTMFYFW